MIYDQVEQLYTVANANFATDLAALATAKGVTITTTCTFVKRQNADVFVNNNLAPLPGCGVYLTRAVTAIKSQGQRFTTGSAVFDYYATGTLPDVLSKQVELAAEALLRTVDRLFGGDIFGAAVEDNSITIELSDGYEKVTDPLYWRRAIVRFPVYDRDTGL